MAQRAPLNTLAGFTIVPLAPVVEHATRRTGSAARRAQRSTWPHASYMPRALPDPNSVARALMLSHAGVALREIGRQLGVSASTVARWLKSVSVTDTERDAVTAAVETFDGDWGTFEDVATVAQVKPDVVRRWLRERCRLALARHFARSAVPVAQVLAP